MKGELLLGYQMKSAKRLSTSTIKKTHAIILKLPMFMGLSLEESQMVMRCMLVEKFAVKTTIFAHGDKIDKIYILVSGTVQLISREGSLILKEQPVALIGDLDFMARLPLRTTTMKAESDVVCISITTHDLSRCLYLSHGLTLKLYRNSMSTLMEKLDTTNVRFNQVMNDIRSGEVPLQGLIAKWEIEPKMGLEIKEGADHEWLDKLTEDTDGDEDLKELEKSPLHCLGFIFLLFARFTDGSLSMEEERLLWSKIGDLGESMSEQELQEVRVETINWLKQTIAHGTEVIKEELVGAALWIKDLKWFDDATKLQVLNDMVDIAKEDDHFHQQEKNWIAILADIWDMQLNI